MGKSVDQIPEKYASDDDVEQKPQGESSWLGGLQNTVGNAALSS